MTIWRREMGACFLSPVAYVTTVVFLAITGFTFLWASIRNDGTLAALPPLFSAAILVWLTLLIAVVCMRLFAEEKRAGTIEALMTAPVTETSVVLGKYAGALTFLALAVAPALSGVFILARLSPGIESVDIGAIRGMCLILFLVSALCASIGLLISLLTRNQIIAAVTGFCVIWFVLLFGEIATVLPVDSGTILSSLSCITHVEEFSRGMIDTRAVVMYLSGTVFVLFAAVRVLESRRWR